MTLRARHLRLEEAGDHAEEVVVLFVREALVVAPAGETCGVAQQEEDVPDADLGPDDETNSLADGRANCALRPKLVPILADRT